MSSTEIEYNKVVESTEKYILFNRVFSLNPSQSKNLIVGVAYIGEGGSGPAAVAVPVVKIINSYWAGIVFTADRWEKFTSNFPLIQSYFGKKKSPKHEDLQFDGECRNIYSFSKILIFLYLKQKISFNMLQESM